jgi:hypothetical protein
MPSVAKLEKNKEAVAWRKKKVVYLLPPLISWMQGGINRYSKRNLSAPSCLLFDNENLLQ